ncbi:3-deoxy-7-phosphoheptulonate synthase [Dehalococcoidia bacterium]|nr:3-deoxy-7-phosphoheptulonate synthase [Dehalococcoidia bacterium]MCL0098153.1 3-deoxy-7-phosphoheptulonate synthase [Dehalococcoidia bacterium]
MTIKLEERNQTRNIDCADFAAEEGKTLLLASRDCKQAGTAVDIGGIKLGLIEVVVMAGPCSVESPGQILRIAREVKQAGATILRGGAFKPRTSPYDFQGLGKAGLEYLRAASSETGLRVVTEIVDPRDVEMVCEYADCLQIGSRNMQNYSLLREVGRSSMPVLLKRGMSASYREFLLAAEYVMAEGNDQVVLCERGIVSLSKELRFTLDLNAVPYLKGKTHLPVIVDPSHGTGSAPLVAAMSRAAIACGADGLILETHYSPEDSISDAAQTISTGEFAPLMKSLATVANAVGRTMAFASAPIALR